MHDLEHKIHEIAQALPNIRPLTEFLHLNMYPGQQSKRFWDALRDISRIYSIVPLPPISFYQEKWNNHDIDPVILDQEIKRHATTEEQFHLLKKNLSRPEQYIHLPEKTYRPIHKLIGKRLHYSLNELTEPILVRFLGGFYDQGLASWKIPKTDRSLLESFFSIALHSYIDFYPVKRSYIRQFENKTASEIISYILSEMFLDEELFGLYIEESLLSLKGWTGFIANLSGFPELILEKRKSSLVDYLAIRLILDKSWIDRIDKKFLKINRSDFLPSDLTKEHIISEENWTVFKIWHEAYEKSVHNSVLISIHDHAQKNISYASPKIQAYFCMDDRECSLRRFIEQELPEIETFGTPGHFGLDFYFKESSNAFLKKHCPAPVAAQHIITAKANTPGRKKNMFVWFEPQGKGIIRDFLSIFLNGVTSGVGLLTRVFFNRQFVRFENNVTHFADIDVLAAKDAPSKGHLHAFTPEVAADRLSVVFKPIGAASFFAKLVVIVGHESTTSNNPYFNAYGCGACSGRTGHVNAIAFCKLANDPEVRLLLAQKYQIEIPQTTLFIPAVHDTTKDTITYFDSQKLEEEHIRLKNLFATTADKALRKNAELRCEQFELVSKKNPEKDYVQDTTQRALSIFEPRPELGHTSNAFCIVGQRNTTKGLSFSRRAFLQSYDWKTDASGDQLLSILLAAVPVCGGINLDYFFSRVNNYSIGAGSKLSHNIIGLVGLCNGTEDDLLTGLANQMIELHEPVRIQFVVEQEVHILEKIINTNPTIASWVKNEWIRLSALCPRTRVISIYENEVFHTLNFGGVEDA